MKKLIVILTAIMACFLAGCLTTPEIRVSECPSQDIIIQGEPDEQGFLQIPKGAFDNPDYYWTLPEFEADMKELMETQQRGESM